MNRIPEAPKKQVVILQEDSRRLEEWMSFFSGLSSRIEVTTLLDAGLIFLLAGTHQAFREKKGMPDDQTIVGWPTLDTTAFALCIDSSLPNSRESHVELRDTYFFCFDDRAFGPMHFEWDGEGSNTFSLQMCDNDTLSWNFIRFLIETRVRELESRVPKLKRR